MRTFAISKDLTCFYYTHKTMRTQPKIPRSPGSWTGSAFQYVGTNAC